MATASSRPRSGARRRIGLDVGFCELCHVDDPPVQAFISKLSEISLSADRGPPDQRSAKSAAVCALRGEMIVDPLPDCQFARLSWRVIFISRNSWPSRAGQNWMSTVCMMPKSKGASQTFARRWRHLRSLGLSDSATILWISSTVEQLKTTSTGPGRKNPVGNIPVTVQILVNESSDTFVFAVLHQKRQRDLDPVVNGRGELKGSVDVGDGDTCGNPGWIQHRNQVPR